MNNLVVYQKCLAHQTSEIFTGYIRVGVNKKIKIFMLGTCKTELRQC